ncbi:DUF1376 domain-containing protein [Sinorhizobium meliloti]|nr:DUF1376 domain-containing protein [Sinorhizobium meliloti]
MSGRPFMQLYVSDFLGDTLHLSTEQVGAYLLLLMAMWNAGGSLPSDEGKLARITRLPLKKWKSIASDLMPFFEMDADVLWHNRLTKELQKSESKSQSRASAGAKGGSAKALKDKEARLANAMPTPQHSPDTITRDISSSLHSEGEAQAPTRGPTEIDQAVEAFSAMARRSGLSVPKAITATRRRSLLLRIEEHGLPVVLDAIERIGRSRFCRGENDRGWRADLDFLCQSKSFVAILEGKYDDRPSRHSQSPPRSRSEFMQRQHDIHMKLKRDLYGEQDEQFAGPTINLAAGDIRSH